MLRTLIAAALAAVLKAVFGRWLTPEEKPDDALVATKAEAKALAQPAADERAVDDRLRRLQQPD